ncbi:MAG TPA: DASS family sodium-coupled anion symporter, partial [Blastocatellia bacterium]|nr:DASS family sodium-coupled anion symporter [Blastocatellia bacterium]
PPIVGGVIWLCPHAGFDARSWGVLCIFGAMISGMIARPLPAGAIIIAGISLANVLGLVTTQEALSGFASATVWLIVAAFIFATGFRTTRLGERIAYHVIAAFGRSSLRLGYSLVIADLILAPMTASNTARAGGVIFPVAQAMAHAFDSRPGVTANRLGAFLFQALYQGNVVTSAMFMTGMAANPLVIEFTRQTANLRLTWAQWALAAAVPGLLSLLIAPLVVHRMCPPEVSDTSEARALARHNLKLLGPLSRPEKLMIAIFVPVLLLWTTESLHGLSATTVAYIGVTALLLTRVLTWGDVLEERGAWDALVWFGGVVMFADKLNKVGLLKAFSNATVGLVAGWRWPLALAVLLVIYLYTHYFFASAAAHVTALFPAFLGLAIVLGAPPLLAALSLGFFSSLNATLTHYGTGSAVVLYGAGYVSQARWWRIGLIISLIHLAIWLGGGFAWWKVIGLW